MAVTKSLKTEILERLDLRKAGPKAVSRKISKMTTNLRESAPQSRVKSRGPKAGASAIYEGKNVIVRTVNESGMAVVRFGNNREVIVRVASLKPVPKQELTEGILGIAAIGPTYREPTNYGFVKFDLDPEDIGLVSLREDDDQEESEDNGSNIRSDGHTGKKEVDELPTPSDTISPAYSDETPPKLISEPLSTHVGAQEEHLWDQPDWDGYDYPADAPEIPTAEFDGDDMGNSRAPHWTDERNAFDGQENREDDHDADDHDADGDEDDHDKVEEATAFDRGGHEHADWKEPVSDDWRRKEERRRAAKQKRASQDANLSGRDVNEGEVTDPARDEGEGHKNLAKMRKDIDISERRSFDDDEGEPKQKPKWQKQDRGNARQKKEKDRTAWMDESFFMSEMDAMLGGSDTEPGSGDTITLTLPAMASIVCTVASKVGDDQTMLKAIVEALAEVSKGKTIDIDDLHAVAAHINGEEMPEMQNREAGEPDHEGMDHEGMEHGDAETWPGDGDKIGSGKTKLMGGIGEQIEYFGGDDVMRWTEMTEDQEIELLRSRAFPNRVRW